MLVSWYKVYHDVLQNMFNLSPIINDYHRKLFEMIVGVLTICHTQNT